MSFAELDLDFEGTTIRCWEGGSGFPVLLLHGSGAGASTWGNYKKVLDPMRQKYRVVAADLVGFGQSGRKTSKPYFDIGLWIRQAQFLVDRFDRPEVGVVGHSLSGALALKLAASDSRITKVLTTGTLGASFPCKPGTRLWRYPEDRAALRQGVETTVCDKTLIDEPELDYRMRVLTAPGYREYYESMFSEEKQHYIDLSALTSDEVARIRAKVLMLHGWQDVNFPPEIACFPLARPLKADMWLLDECAHSVALEHPRMFLMAADVLFGN